MAALGGHLDRPAVRAAPRRRAHVAPVLDHQPFEIERHVSPFAGLDQRPASDFDRASGILLVAGQEHDDVGLSERSGALHRAQRGDDHRDPAFVVAGSRTLTLVSAAGPALERRVRLEHRVEVGDQQHALAAPIPLVRRDEVAGAADPLEVDPLDLEAQRLELRLHHLRDGFDARDVQRAAVLVHPAPEQVERALLLGIDGLDHPLLPRAEPRGGRGGEEESKGGEEREQDS